MRRETIRCLKETAAKCRLNVVRMLRASGHGHIGGTYSSIDMVTALYFYKMNVNPEKPDWEDRDRFLLSAGHKSMVQYAVLAEKGYFPKEILDTYGHLHSKLAGHPNMHKLPGVEASTGALGHGLQISGKVTDVMDFTPIGDKFREFGWAVREIDGNNMDEIVEAFDALPFEEGKPSMIVAHTVKAKGLKEGEGKASYHYWNPSKEDCDALEKDLMEQLRGYEDEI